MALITLAQIRGPCLLMKHEARLGWQNKISGKFLAGSATTVDTSYVRRIFYTTQRLDLFAWCVRLSRLLVVFRMHFKSLHFHSFSHSFTACNGIVSYMYSRSVDEFVKLVLVKALCLPLLTYRVGALDLSATCMLEWQFQDDIWYESVKRLQY